MRKIAWLLICCLALTGCAGRVELSLMAIALGVDADEGGVTLTLKAPDYSAASQDKAAQKGYLTLSARGETWEAAVAALLASSPLDIRFGQLREVAVSRQALAHHALRELLGGVDRLPNVRSHALVLLCPGEARTLIEAQQPVIGKRLSKYLDLSMQHAQAQGDIPTTTLACALRDLTGPWRDPLLTWAEATPEGVAYAGGWAVSGEGEVTPLTGHEVQLYRLLTGERQRLRFDYQGQVLGAEVRGGVDQAVAGNALVLRVPVTVLYSLYEEAPPPGAAEALRQEVVALMGKLQAAHCDALGFGNWAVREYADLDAWLASGWPARYAASEVRVEVVAAYRQERME